MSDIEAQLDSNGAGLGDHMVDISVSVETGNEIGIAPLGCSRTDNGEQVDYTVELMVLDYTIAPYIDTSDI